MQTTLNAFRLFKVNLGFLCVFAVSTLVISDWASAAPHVGVFQVVKGEVEVHRSGKVKPASVGMQVFSQDKIVTKPDARARVQMLDRNILNVSPDSSITLERYVAGGSAEIKVDSGKLRSSVDKNSYDGKNRSFNVKTPTAVAGVRGTDFLTSFNPSTQQSQVVTFSGSVTVVALDPSGQGPRGQAVVVGPSQATTVAPGAPPSQPVTVDASDLNFLEAESRDDSASSGPSSGPSSEGANQAQAGSNDSSGDSSNNTSGNSFGNSSGNSLGNNSASNSSGNSASQSDGGQTSGGAANSGTNRSGASGGNSAGSLAAGAPRAPSSAAAGSQAAGAPTPPRMVQSSDLSTNLGGGANIPTPPTISMPSNLTMINSPTGSLAPVPTISPELNQIINDTTVVNRNPNSNTTINLIAPK